MTAVVPYAEHRCCARHLWTNLQRALGSNQKTIDLFWNAARSTYQAEFKRWMEELKKCNIEAYNWLADKPLSQWTRCEFQTFCLSDLLLNNRCESWNKCILQARCKPIISMLETIRCQLMERFWKKKKFAEDNFAGKLCPRIQKKLDAAKIKSMSCQAIPNGAMSFEVRFDDKQMVVDLNKHTCTCCKWDLTGIPCYHAVSCIYFLHQFPEIYVDECYEVTKYISAYGFNVSPVIGHESWLPSIRGPILPCGIGY
ncbi:hypothetical protein LINPERHAP1_LOCUS35189 [Linum perenne]